MTQRLDFGLQTYLGNVADPALEQDVATKHYVDGIALNAITAITLTVPSVLSVSPATITGGAGTFAITLATQQANRIFAGPPSGAAAIPTFRHLAPADIDGLALTLSSITLSGATSGTIRLIAPDEVTISYTLTLPQQPTELSFLQTNAQGVLTWTPVPAPTLTNVLTNGATANNLNLTLTGTGQLRTTAGLRLVGLNTGGITFTANDDSGSYTLAWPAADGTAGQFLRTNANGSLSWASVILTVPPLDDVLANGNTSTRSIILTGTGLYESTAGVRLRDGGTNTITLKAPLQVTTSYTLTLPPTAGTANYFLQTDGTGTTTWAQVVTTVPTLNIVMTAGTPNNTVADQTIRLTGTGVFESTAGLQLNGSLAGALTLRAAATTTSYALTWPAAAPSVDGLYLTSTQFGTLAWTALPSIPNLEQVLARGNLATNYPIVLSGAGYSGTSLALLDAQTPLPNGITIVAPAAVTSSYTLTLPVLPGTANQFLQTNGSGTTTWATALTSVPTLGQVNAAGNLIENGTSIWANNTVNPVQTTVISGGSVGTKLITFSGATYSVAINAPTATTGGANYSLYLPSAQGANATTLVNNGSGVLSWGTTPGAINLTMPAEFTVTGNNSAAITVGKAVQYPNLVWTSGVSSGGGTNAQFIYTLDYPQAKFLPGGSATTQFIFNTVGTSTGFFFYAINLTNLNYTDTVMAQLAASSQAQGVPANYKVTFNAFNGTIVFSCTIKGPIATPGQTLRAVFFPSSGVSFTQGTGSFSGVAVDGSNVSGTAAYSTPSFAPLAPAHLPLSSFGSPGALFPDNLSNVVSSGGQLSTGLNIQGTLAAVATTSYNSTGFNSTLTTPYIAGSYPLVIDGYTPSVGDKVLLTGQGQTYTGGRYEYGASNGSFIVTANSPSTSNPVTSLTSNTTLTRLYFSDGDIAILGAGYTSSSFTINGVTPQPIAASATVSDANGNSAFFYTSYANWANLTVGQGTIINGTLYYITSLTLVLGPFYRVNLNAAVSLSAQQLVKFFTLTSVTIASVTSPTAFVLSQTDYNNLSSSTTLFSIYNGTAFTVTSFVSGTRTVNISDAISAPANTVLRFYAGNTITTSAAITVTAGDTLTFTSSGYLMQRSTDPVVFGGVWRIANGNTYKNSIWINRTTAAIALNLTGLTYGLLAQAGLTPNLGAVLASGNTSSLTLWALSTTAGYSQVNQLTLAGSATTLATSLTAAGNDDNVSIEFIPKGTGAIVLGTSAGTTPLWAANSAVAPVTLTPGTTGQVLTSVGPGKTPIWAPFALTPPAGSTGQIQYNNNGVFWSSANLSFSGTALSLTGNLTVDGAINAVSGSVSSAPVGQNDIARLADVQAATSGFKPQGTVAAVATSSVGTVFTPGGYGTSTLTGTTGLIIDGYTPSDGTGASPQDRVLLVNQFAIDTYGANVTNGVYVVTSNTIAGFVLTRISTVATYGNTWIIANGAMYANSIWENTTTGTITIDVTPLIYIQFAPAYLVPPTPTLNQVLIAGASSILPIAVGTLVAGSNATNTITLTGSPTITTLVSSSTLVLDGTSGGVQLGTVGTTPLLAATSAVVPAPIPGAPGQVLTSAGSGKTPYWNTPALTPPAGANGYLQYYNNASFGASSNLQWTDSGGLVMGHGFDPDTGLTLNTVTLLASSSAAGATTLTNLGSGGYVLSNSSHCSLTLGLTDGAVTLSAINSTGGSTASNLNLYTQAGVINLKGITGGQDQNNYIRIAPSDTGSPSIGAYGASDSNVALQLFGQGTAGLQFGQLSASNPWYVPDITSGTPPTSWTAGTSGQLLSSTGPTGSPKWINPPVTTTPGGVTDSIQYKDANNNFAGSEYLTWNAVDGVKLTYYNAQAITPTAGPTLVLAPPLPNSGDVQTANAFFTLSGNSTGGFAYTNSTNTQLTLSLAANRVSFNTADTSVDDLARDVVINAYKGSIYLGARNATDSVFSQYESNLRITPSNAQTTPVALGISSIWTDQKLVIDGAGQGGVQLGTAGSTPLFAADSAVFTAYTPGAQGQVLVSNGPGATPYWATPVRTAAAGALYDVQFNVAGVFRGVDAFQFNSVTNTVSIIGDITLEGGTASFPSGTVAATPTQPTQIARLADIQYATAGFKPQGTVAAIATENIGTTYIPPTALPAQLTGTGQLSIDASSPATGTRVLLTNQGAFDYTDPVVGHIDALVANGAWDVIDNGAVSGTFLLQRVTDTPLYGNSYLATGGTSFTNSVWENITQGTIVPDTTPQIYVQFSAPFTTPSLQVVLENTPVTNTLPINSGTLRAGRDAVNYIQLTGAATTTAPTLTAAGADLDIRLIVSGKDQGGVQLGSVSGTDPLFFAPTANAGSGYTPTAGTLGQVLTSSGAAKTPYWATPTTGTVTSLAISSAMQGAFTLTNASTTPLLAFASGAASGKYLDGAGSWVTLPTVNPGTVTSIGMTVPEPLAITPSTPITSSGTFALTWGTGQIPVANLGSQTASNTTYLRGDGQWRNPVAGDSGQIQFNTSNALAASNLLTWDSTAGLSIASGINAKNGLVLRPAAAGAAPSISAVGSDANVDLKLVSKGLGGVVIGNMTTSNGLTMLPSGTTATLLYATSTVNANLNLNIKGQGTGAVVIGETSEYAALVVAGSLSDRVDLGIGGASTLTNVNFYISAKGTGFIRLNANSGVQLGSSTSPVPLFAANAATQTSVTAGTTGQVLTSAGSGKTPYWQTVNFVDWGSYASSGRNDQSWEPATSISATFTDPGATVTGSVYRYYRKSAAGGTASAYYRFVPTTDNTSYDTALSYDSFWTNFTGSSGGTTGTLSSLLSQRGQF